MGKRGRPRYPDILTPREWEVLSLLRENLTNEQIAERLGVTLHAARYHVSEILSKLGVATREEAAAWQPKEARLGPRWSIAFQIWLTAAAAVALIAVGVLAWGVSRGSGDDSQAGLVLESPTASGSASGSRSPTPTPGFSTPPAGVANVRAMQLVNLSFAWILTDSQLTSTQFVPAGEKILIQTKDITPPGVSIADIRGVHFLDSVHGWLVANGATTNAAANDQTTSTQLLVYRTEDSGQNWQSFPLSDSFIYYAVRYGPAQIDFLDANRGWIVVSTQQSMNSPSGDLFRTDDGGQTWTKLAVPTGDGVHFTDANNGWQTARHCSTCPTNSLYVTHDGGQTWSDASDITPTSTPAGQRAFGPPVAITGGHLLLPVTITVQNENVTLPADFVLYSSTDGGQSWHPIAQTSIGPYEIGTVAASYIFASGAVVVFAAGGTAYQLAPGATELLQFPITGLSGAIDVQFADDKHGWALVNESLCASFKTNCWSLNYIEQTDDGGRTWGAP